MLLSDFGRTLYQKQLRFGALSGIELARAAVVAAGIGVLLVALGYDVLAWQVLAVQGAALWIVSLAIAGRHLARPSLSAPLRPLLHPRHGYLLGYFLVLAVFSQVDILMLRILADTDTLASYGSAARYYYLLSLALAAVHTIFLPAMQKVENVQALDELFHRHLGLLAGFAPLVAALALLSHWVLPWVDLGRYPEAVPTLQILCLSAVISFAFSPYVNLVFVFRRYRFLFFLIVAALAVNIALNAALIPTLGGKGAATATLVASACVTVSIFVLSRRLRKAARATGGRLSDAMQTGGTAGTR
jgi:O-antigen/teichoic acid export membrane protein